MDTIDKAQWFAAWHHRYQKYGNDPYFYHLGQVAAVLGEFNIDSKNLLAAAWLHDILEDTEVTKTTLLSEFGPIIGSLVDCVTGEGETRKVRNQSIYAKIDRNSAPAILKVADRIANVRNCKIASSLYQMYKNEYYEFRKAIYTETCNTPLNQMWETLDKLMEYSGD